MGAARAGQGVLLVGCPGSRRRFWEGGTTAFCRGASSGVSFTLKVSLGERIYTKI